MEETMLYRQDLTNKNKRINEYMQKIVSNNNNHKCDCCPYGHHVNVDFVEFAKDISNSHNELQKIRRYQRKLERAQCNLLNKSDAHSTFPKQSIILSRNFTNQLSCSSSDSNSSDLIDSNIRPPKKNNKKIDGKNNNQSESNETVYEGDRNETDRASRSSDDSSAHSLTIDNPDDNVSNNAANCFLKTFSSSKSNSYRSKSFVVSYEHLMSIREQMSASLKRVQDLESEVKNIPAFRQRIDSVSKENHQLKCELAHQREIIELNNTKSEWNRKINEIASNWRSINDLPNQLLSNIERILAIKINHNQSVFANNNKPPKQIKTKSSQTDVNGSVIIDTLSFFTNNSLSKELEFPAPSSDEWLCSKTPKKRNFGVTVRPTQHHFAQQTAPILSKSLPLDEELIARSMDCFESECDRKLGLSAFDFVENVLRNSPPKHALASLKSQLESLDRSCFSNRSIESKYSQTQIPSPPTHIGCQISAETVNKSISATTQSVDVATDSRLITTSDFSSQTASSICLNCISTQTNYRSDSTIDQSALTDQYLIDDLIAQQIEKSVELIHKELRSEIELSESRRVSQLENKPEKPLIDSYSTGTSGELSKESSTQITQPMDRVCTTYSSPIVHSSIQGDLQRQALSNLRRCEISYSYYDNDGDQDDLCEQQRTQPSCGSPFPFQKNPDFDNQVSNDVEQSNSTSSSPVEASYYSVDGRIEYKRNDHLEELDEIAEDNVIENPLVLEDPAEENAPNPNITQKTTDDSSPTQFSSTVQQACELVALWMNDSTTTCSKDLNDSLAVIRKFWFDVSSNSNSNLKYFMDKFATFNPTLQERVINMTDLNGNTCLHYAVSEGRWSVVRLLLQTNQVNVNKTNNAGYTVLMLVAVSENIDEEALKMLIDQSEIDKQSLNNTQQTALMIAASQGKTKFVQLLLEKGASVNITDSDGSTALMCACDNGHLEVVRLLLSRPDTDTELEDNTGCNAMKIALDNSHKDIALLIFARNNLQKSQRSKRRSGSSSHPTSPLNQRKFK